MSRSVFTDDSGQRYVLDADQGFRAVTPAEAAALDESFVEEGANTSGSIISEMYYGVKSLIEGSASLAFGGDFEDWVNPETARRLAEASGDLEMRRDIKPSATAGWELGLAAADVALGAGVDDVARRTGVALAKRKAQQRGIDALDPHERKRLDGSTHALRSDEVAPEELSQLGVVANDAARQRGRAAAATGGMDSAGAMRAHQTGLWNLLEEIPGLRHVWETFEQYMGQQRNLGPTQLAHIDAGTAERVGFRYLPGQENGNGIVAEIIKSQPFMADAFDDVLGHNSERLGELFMRAAGLDGDLTGPSVLGDLDRVLAERFGALQAKVKPRRMSADTFEEIKPYLTTQERDAIARTADESGVVTLDGEQLFAVRSNINDAMFGLRRANQATAAREAQQGLRKLDEVIESQLSPEDVAEWRDAQQTFRLRLAAEDIFTPQGDISYRKLNNALNRTFKQEFKYQTMAPRDNPKISDEMADLMDFTSLASAFTENLGDSGTATRNAINLLLSGSPREAMQKFATQRAGARFITDVVLGDVDRGARMAAPTPDDLAEVGAGSGAAAAAAGQ